MHLKDLQRKMSEDNIFFNVTQKVPHDIELLLDHNPTTNHQSQAIYYPHPDQLFQSKNETTKKCMKATLRLTQKRGTKILLPHIISN